MVKQTIEIERRAIYSYGKRRGFVYDAILRSGGKTFRATEKSRAEAKAAVLRDRDYVATASATCAGGCALFAQGYEAWVFELPEGGSMCFGAVDYGAALERVRADYGDQDRLTAFFEVA